MFQGHPYIFCKHGEGEDCASKPPNNDMWDGYIVEFIKEVMKEINTSYIIVPVKDGGYGTLTTGGSWDGMVGELIRGVSLVGNRNFCYSFGFV